MWIYFAIFFAKLVEVSLATVRNVLINRGEKVKGSIIGFFEVALWVVVAGNVLTSLQEDPLKALMYCLAFALGNYVGVTIEGKLAIGTSYIQAMVPEEQRQAVSDAMRQRGFGVTVIEGEGMESKVDIMMIYLKRKCVPEAVAILKQFSPTSLVTVNDVRQLRNGYIK